MKKTGFTLVELIVVITILAILGTIAFLSLQGYSQEAKNSKVASDLRTLIAAIETESTKGQGFALINLVDTVTPYGSKVSSGTFSSGVSLSGVIYNVGKINFPFIRQSDMDFKDAEGNEYIASIISDPNQVENTFYQIAGQTKNQAGTYDALVKGNYLKLGTGDIDGLISGSGYTNGITENSKNMPAPGIY